MLFARGKINEFVNEALDGKATCTIKIRYAGYALDRLAKELAKDGEQKPADLIGECLTAVCPECGLGTQGQGLFVLSFAKAIGGGANIRFTGDTGGGERLVRGRCRNYSCTSTRVTLVWKPHASPSSLPVTPRVVERTRFAGVFARLQPYRLWVQSAFLFVWLWPFGFRYHGICAPVFHCYACPLATFACPIGVLANFSALHLIPFMTIGLLVAFGALVGSLFCGWACPFGWLQDLIAKIPTPKFELPRWTGHFRFVVLGVTVIAIPYLYGESHPLFVCRICPAGGVEAALPGVVQQALTGQQIVWPNAVKLGIIVAFLAAILFFKRPWCRILCPLGVIFSSLNKVSAFFLGVDRSACTHCKQCRKLCQYNIKPDRSPNNLRCIRCLECTRCSFGALAPHTILERPREAPAGPGPAAAAQPR